MRAFLVVLFAVSGKSIGVSFAVEGGENERSRCARNQQSAGEALERAWEAKAKERGSVAAWCAKESERDGISKLSKWKVLVWSALYDLPRAEHFF